MPETNARAEFAVDLGDLAKLKADIIAGGERRIIVGGCADLGEHFGHLRSAFIGLPELCFAHAQLIVLIRREIHLSENLRLFFHLWRTEAEFLTSHLSSRWLISACDTFADYGTDAQQAAAMPLIVLVNMTKLADTEYISIKSSAAIVRNYNFIAERFEQDNPVELWDGVTAYFPRFGDMPRNMFRRAMKLADTDPALRFIARTLIRRAVEADTLLGRMSRLNPAFLPVELRAPVEAPPLAPDR